MQGLKPEQQIYKKNIFDLLKGQLPLVNQLPGIADPLIGAGLGYGIGQMLNKNGKTGMMIGGGLGAMNTIANMLNPKDMY